MNCEHIETDCREEIGITVGLIDALMSISRVLATRDLTSKNVRGALQDLVRDEDLKFILDYVFTENGL